MLFRVSFISQSGPLKIVPSVDKAFDGVVLGKANQSFTINVVCSNEKEPFAAKLFIDGIEVISRKTFKRKGNFFGFRKGNGEYDQFIFANPPFLADYGQIASELKSKASKMGEIRIVFYSAFETLCTASKMRGNSQGRPPINNSNQFIPIPQADSKLVQTRCLSVGVGNAFQVPIPSDFLNSQNFQNKVKFTKGNYEEPIDQILLRYTNPPTLIAHGLLSPFNLNQYKFFPEWYLRKNKLILQAIIFTIMKNLGLKKLPHEQVYSSFEELCGLKLANLIEGDLKSFFSQTTFLTVTAKEVLVTKQMTTDDIIKEVCEGHQNAFCVDKDPRDSEEKRFIGKREPTSYPSVQRKPQRSMNNLK